MSVDNVDIVLRLRGAAKFNKDTAQARDGMGRFSKETDKADKSMRKSSRSSSTFGKNIGKMKTAAVGLGAGLAGLGIGSALMSSVDQTTQLAKTTIGLSKNFGMATDTASQWGAVAQARAIDAKTLHMAFTRLSRATMDFENGGASVTRAFGEMGVSQKQMAATNGDFSAQLGLVANGLSNIDDRARRTAVAQQIFGRGAAGLLPIIREGKTALADQLAMAREHGAYFGNKSIKDLESWIAAQREGEIAAIGLNITLSETLVPVLTKLREVTTSVIDTFNGAPGVVQVLTLAAIGLTGAVAGLSAAIFLLGPGLAFIGGAMTWLAGTTLALRIGLMLLAIQTALVTAAQWLWNAALIIGAGAMAILTSPITLIVLGIALLIAGFVLAYKKVTWFRKGVDAVWSFVKKYWPLLIGILTGGLVPAIYLIVKNFGKIKAAARSAFNGLKSIFKGVVNFMIKMWNSLDFGFQIKIPGWVPKYGGQTFGIKDLIPDMGPMLANGGVVSGLGSWITGEQGAERNTLLPGGRVHVQPLETAAMAGGGGGVFEIHVHSILDGREIAHSVSRAAADETARRGR